MLKCLLLFMLSILGLNTIGYCKNATSISTQQELSAGARILFKDVVNSLSEKEKETIYKLTEFTLSPDQKGFLVHPSEQAFQPIVQIFDVNNDRVKEVFIVYGNSEISGLAGISTMVFLKGVEPNYSKQLDLPGFISIIPGQLKYPSIAYLGPGFQHTMYSYFKTAYADNGTYPDKQLESWPQIQLEELAKIYKASGDGAVTSTLAELQKRYFKQLADYQTAHKHKAIPNAVVRGPEKFLGKWWTAGEYDHPFIIEKKGNIYSINRLRLGLKEKPPVLAFNAKADRLEAWLEKNGLRLKLLIVYHAELNQLEIRPEQASYGSSVYLKRY